VFDVLFVQLELGSTS